MERYDMGNQALKINELTVVEDELQPKQRIELGNGVVMVVCDVDRAKAEFIMSRLHKQQRKLRKGHIQRIVRELEQGRFNVTGDPFHFDTHGCCINGQHRAAAVLQSGIPISNAVVLLGMEPESIMNLDTGSMPRSGIDAMHMASGISVSPQVFAAVILEHCDFKSKLRTQLSKAEQAEIVQECEYLDELTKLRNAGVASGMGTPGGVLAAALRCMKVNRKQAYQFFLHALRNEHVVDGTPQDALRILSTAIFNSKKAHGYEAARDLAARCIKAWNAVRSGTSIQNLRYSGTIPPAV